MLSANMLGQLIPFLVAPLLARIFSPVDFAVQANFLAIVNLLGIVATGRLELAIPLPKEHRKAQDLAFTGMMITLALSLISVLIPVFSVEIGAWYEDAALPDYLWLVPISVASVGVLGIANNWVLRGQKYRVMSVGKVSQSLVNNLLAALLGYIGWGVSGLIIAWLLSQFVNAALLLMTVNKKPGRSDFNMEVMKSTLSEYRDFPLINSLHAFTDVFVTQFLLFWLIATGFGQFELGLFALMFRYVRAPIVLVTSSVSQLYYVEAGKLMQQGQSALPVMTRTLRTTFLFAIPFILVLLFFGPDLFGWYLGTEWIRAGEYAQCISPMLFLYFLVSPVSGTPVLKGKQKQAFVFSLLGYGISTAGLLTALYLGKSFSTALWLYSGGYSLYQVFLLIWYRKLIR
ncbi:MAG: oligosaccharide flippase family protein [Bacteroidia bacterium]